MKKVYIVQIGCYSDKHIIGAFDTKEEAESFILKSNTGDSWNDPFIEEIEIGGLYKNGNLIPFYVNKVYYKDRNNYEHIHFCEWSLSDEIKKLELSVKDGEGNPQETWNFQKGRVREFYGTIFAESKDHAQKILGEYTLNYNSNFPLNI